MKASRSALFFALLAPTVGCLTPEAAQSFKPTTTVGSVAVGKEPSLPTKETTEIKLKLATDYEAQGFLPDAAAQYEAARELDPKIKNVSRRLAVIYDQLGNEHKALAEFELAVKQTPKDADLLNDYGYCHYNRGRWTEAEKHFREALAIKADHRRAITNLGLCLAQQGKIDEALSTFQKVNRPAEAKANVAFVLATQGKKAEARALYQDALNKEPSLVTARQGLLSLDAPPKAPASAPVATVAASAAPKRMLTPECDLPELSPVTIEAKTTK